MSFDRMRGMLNRAAEIRESEQQQVFDSLDEIHARLAALEQRAGHCTTSYPIPTAPRSASWPSGSTDKPRRSWTRRTPRSAVVPRAVESLPDKLAKPFAQLDGRLGGRQPDGGRFGRMDGLDDRLGGLHKRLDELDHRLDRHEMRLDAMPTSVGLPLREKIDGVERMVREQLDATARAMDESAEGMRNLLGDTTSPAPPPKPRGPTRG